MRPKEKPNKGSRHKHHHESDSDSDRGRRDPTQVECAARSSRKHRDQHDSVERKQLNERRRHNDRPWQRGTSPFEAEEPMAYGALSRPTAEQNVKIDKDKPNFEVSGKLAEETNTYKGIVIKYAEPPEARKPKKRWRLYPFKGEESMKVMHIHRQSAYLLGRDRRVADIPIDHPSCSKQHAVLQFRLVNYTRENGSEGRRIRPYIIDLGAANGTYLNNKRIDAERYVELMEKDVLKFGFSTREYVVLTDKADASELEGVEQVEEEGFEDIDD